MQPPTQQGVATYDRCQSFCTCLATRKHAHQHVSMASLGQHRHVRPGPDLEDGKVVIHAVSLQAVHDTRRQVLLVLIVLRSCSVYVHGLCQSCA